MEATGKKLISEIEKIKAVEGVKDVVLENVYEPLDDVQTADVKAEAVKKALLEYTGAGLRIAIIDSGVNDKHQSFDADALNYSLKQSAPDADNNGAVDDKELAEYKEALDFMTKSDVLDAVNTKHLHVLPQHQDAENLYLNDKISFAYNYADFSLFTQNGGARRRCPIGRLFNFQRSREKLSLTYLDKGYRNGHPILHP